jgi:DNA-binding XRE family transcriptional regulator
MNLKSKILRYYDAQKIIDFNTETIRNINKILIDTQIILISTIKEIQYYENKLQLLTTTSIIKGTISQDETDQYNKNINLKNKLNNIIEPNEDLINTLKEEITKSKATITEIEKDEYAMSILNLEKEIKKYSLYGSIKNTQDDTSNKFNITAKSRADITFTLNIHQSYTIEYVKYLLSNQSGIPIHEIRLIYNGSELDNNKIINEYKIKSNSIVHIILHAGICSLL